MARSASGQSLTDHVTLAFHFALPIATTTCEYASLLLNQRDSDDNRWLQTVSGD